MPPKAMMKGRVVVGTKHVGTFGKLHEITDTVKDVINAFVQKAAEAAERTLVFRKVYSCATEEHMIAKQGTVLDPDDLSELTVANLRDDNTRFLHIDTLDDDAGAAAGPLPSAFEKMSQSQQDLERGLPTPPLGNSLSHRLFRALLVAAEKESLSFPKLDVNESGKRMLTAMSKALEYVLPFGEAEPSPLRLDGRVHLTIPRRFSTKVCTPALALLHSAFPPSPAPPCYRAVETGGT